ncbi:hypothetical protein B0H14DRAFT_2331766, partial [Mycena olivaceomarginata]
GFGPRVDCTTIYNFSAQRTVCHLTTRRFLRHPLLKSFLAKKLPNLLDPTLSDFHISLANHSHVKSFIDQVRQELFSKGTSWAGAYL